MSDVSKVIANLRKYNAKALKNIVKAVEEATLDLQAEAISKAPIDTGDLRGSSSADTKVTSTNIKGEVGFNEEYALKQHEELNYNHPMGGEAKYLESPLKENSTKYRNEIRKAIKEVT